jgi:GDP-D-mannose dehydratase
MLKWKPRVSFEQLIRMMVNADLARVEKEIRDSA